MRTVLLTLALAAGQLPTPTRLVEARRVFLTADGVERTTLQELGQQITEWGRWSLQADEASSDLVMVLTRTPDPGDARGWVLTIREPSGGTPTPLYSDVETGSYAAGAITQLMTRLKRALGAPPVDGTRRSDAAEQTGTAAAATRAEPCRVFVTEQAVNPSFYTVVTRIKYRKKYYGGSSHAWEGMAREGRKVDADAVVAVNINFRPSMFSWASPHAEGIAVRWNDEGRKHFPTLVGQCFEAADGSR